MISATSGSVKSAPVFVVVAEPQPGALLVNDAQVLGVGQPLGLAPGEAPTAGTRYEVRLTGISTPLSSGTVVLAAENAPVAGKVVAVRNESGAMVVTLAMTPLRELFARHDINWTIDLAELPSATPPVLARSANSSGSVAAPSFLTPVTAFTCDASLGPVLFDRRVQLAPDFSVRLEYINNPGHYRVAITGTQKIVGSISLKLNAGFQVKGECRAQVPLHIPIGGPLALLVMPSVTLGVGVSLSGELGVTAGELSVTGEFGAELGVGWECHGTAASCGTLSHVAPINDVKPKFEVFNPQTGMRAKLEGQVFVFATLDAVFATSLKFGILEAKAGPVQSVDLGWEDDQAINPTYASKYDLKLEAVIQPGAQLQKVLDMIASGITLTYQAKASIDISESPSGTLTVSHPVVPPSGQAVDIKVDLTNTDYFLIGYNVVRVELWRKKPDEAVFSYMRTFNVTASNQKVFTYSWQPTVDDLGTTEFAAFVYTQFPVPGLEVAPNSIAKVLVSCFSTPRVDATTAANANVCPPDTWQGTATFFAPGELKIDVNVTWLRNPRATDPNHVTYMASGTASVKWIRSESKGCTVTPTVFAINEDDGTDAGGLTVDISEDPPAFGVLSYVLMPVTETCPGSGPGDYQIVMLWASGSGQVTANRTLIQGRTDLGGGSYFEWRFARP